MSSKVGSLQRLLYKSGWSLNSNELMQLVMNMYWLANAW